MIVKNSAGLYPWSRDLEASSDVRLKELEGFAMLLGWLEKFIAGNGLSPSREACERFWKEQVRSRPREKWQLDQWGAAIRWYLRWLEHRTAKGGEVRSLPERVRDAVHRAGARQGKAVRTRQTYGRWVAAFARWAGDERAVMRPDKARDFLSWQVTERKVSYASQKLGLNALVFFYKAVCGMDEVDLEVRLRKTEPRMPVVLEVKEVLAVLDKIDEKYGLMARIQYGGGLRLMELVRLRVKDVDQERGIITIREAKGDKHRTTILPECLRHASVGRWDGFADDPDAARACGCEDDGNLHACGEGGGSNGSEEPAGPSGGVLLNQKSTIKNQQSKINNQKSKIKNQQSKINNQQSTINNQQSTIGNQQSEINNRQSDGGTVRRWIEEEGAD